MNAKVILLQKLKNWFDCWKLLNSFATVASIFLFYLFNFDIKSHINCILLHILSYNSIRHRRIFDIIEFICKFTIELLLRSKMKQLKNWMQQLCYCKSWKINLIAESCWIFFATIELFDLFYLLNFDLLKNNFLKNYSRALL